MTIKRLDEIFCQIFRVILAAVLVFATNFNAQSTACNSLFVDHLTVNSILNPSGIDDNPVFGWHIHSQQRGVCQKSYQICVSEDSTFSEVKWTSGIVESSESNNVKVDGLGLDASTRYFWRVKVEDQSGNIFTSNEKAFFDTGVMNDWSGAKRIRQGNFEYSSKLSYRQSIEMDLTTIAGNPGIMFGAVEERSGFIWQILLDKGANPILHRTKRSYSNILELGETEIGQFSVNDFLNQEVKVTINIIDGRIIETYINDIQIDAYTSDSGLVYVERIGVCDRTGSCSSPEIYLDNVKHIITGCDGQSYIIVDEDFENEISLYFTDINIVDRELGAAAHIIGVDGQYCKLNLKSKSPIFSHCFTTSKTVKSAFIHSSALGVFDLFINGERVGNVVDDGKIQYDELKPGWTHYLDKSHYFTYEISHYLRDGENMIGAVVSPGWVHGSISKSLYSTNGIPFLSFIGKLVINYTDGTSDVIVTDENWETSRFTPFLTAEIYEGEYFDARYKMPWDLECDYPKFNSLIDSFENVLEPFPGRGVKILKPLYPQEIIVYEGTNPYNDYGTINVIAEYRDKPTLEGVQHIKLAKGQTAIFDFGQNCAAVPCFMAKGKENTRMQIRFAEILNDSGSRERFNDGPQGSIFRSNLRLEEVGRLFYVFSGLDQYETYRPLTTYYGYRYCEITASDDIEICYVKSLPLSSSYTDEGYVKTDNESINHLFECVMWGQRSNMVSIPTDCPSRNERLGWTGDAQIFAPSALFNADVTEFLRKWLGDMRDCQRNDGAYADIAPQCLDKYGNGAWADAGIIVTWQLYLRSGNIDIIRENYDSMCRYMDYLSSIHEPKLYYPGPGTLYGDWLAVKDTDKRFVSQAYYYLDACLMKKMASAMNDNLGEYVEDIDKFSSLCDNIKNEIQSVYFEENGLKNPTQTACALAICFDLYKDDTQKEQLAYQLESILIANGTKLDTGFVGTQYLCQALSSSGLNDLAYALLLQRDYPSWLYCLDQGGTTMWERWDSYKEDCGIYPYIINSFNHYAFGAVVEWMYKYMAGISTDEDSVGFKTIRFKPYLDLRSDIPYAQDAIKHVEASTSTPFGFVLSEWKVDDDDSFYYHIVVPGNTEGIVEIPKYKGDYAVFEGGKLACDVENIEFLGESDDRFIFKVGSGEYFFSLCEPTSINDTSSQINVVCYPNPTSGIMHIDSPMEITNVHLIDFAGRLLNSWNINSSSNNYSIDLSSTLSGVYFLVIETEQGNTLKKIIKI